MCNCGNDWNNGFRSINGYSGFSERVVSNNVSVRRSDSRFDSGFIPWSSGGGSSYVDDVFLVSNRKVVKKRNRY